MTLTITPAKLKGPVIPPPSKSQAHRLLIAAALAGGESVIHNVAYSADIEATISCLEELGAAFHREGEALYVTGLGAGPMSPMGRMALPRLDCGESGSTLRFLIPVALAVRGGGIFTGQGRLMERPQGPYFDIFREKGIFFTQKEGALTVRGRLTPGEYRLPGNVSSQFFTGLLLALPLLEGPSALISTTHLESEGYVQLTLQAMARFGVEGAMTMSLPPQYHLPGGQSYTPAEVSVEADWSQAAFWYAAKGMGNQVDIIEMDPDSSQGDREIEKYYVKLKGEGEVDLDVSGCPDLVPPLAVMAAFRPGQVTHLTNAARKGGRRPRFSHRHGGGTPSRRGEGGCPQRPPHRHDAGHCRHPVRKTHHPHRGGERKEILSQLLGRLCKLKWKNRNHVRGGPMG